MESATERATRSLRRSVLFMVTMVALTTVLLAAYANAKVLFEVQADRLDNSVTSGRFDDYIAFYAAGELVKEGRGGEIYDIDVITAKEQEVAERPVGGTGSLGFFNPPFVAVIFIPLTLLSVSVAGVVILGINATLVAVVATALRRMLGWTGLVEGGVVLVGAISLNSVFWLMGHGQFSMLLVAGFLGFFWFQRQGKPAQSGLALTLLLVKPQMAVLPILVLLWRRDWPALRAFSAVAGGLVVVSVIAAGPAVLWEYPSFALSSTGWDMEHGINIERMYGWNGLFANLLPNHSMAHLAVTTTVTLVTVGLVLRAFGNSESNSSRFALAFGAMVAGAILINPHIYLQDMVLMVLVLAGGYLGTREMGWPVSLWVTLATVVWIAQETTDRLYNATAVNGPSMLLIGLMVAFIVMAEAIANADAGREARLAAKPQAA